MGRLRKKNRHMMPRMQMKGGRYYYTPFVDGKLKWKALGSDYGQALVQWAELEKSALPDVKIFEDLAREFQLRVVQKWKPTTQKTYPYFQAALVTTFGGMSITDIEASHVYGHVEKREQEGAATSGLREKSVLGSMMEFARRNGWVKINPCLGMRLAGSKVRSRYIRDGEYAAIFQAANPAVKAAMKLAYLTGLRIGDLLKLKRSDVSEEGIWVAQGKTGVQALYRMTPELAEAIEYAKTLRKRVTAIHLIARRDGAPYTYAGFRSMWNRACAKAKIEDAHFHDIRAKATTDADAQGRDPQKFTLHASREMANRYVKARQFKTVEPMAPSSKMGCNPLKSGA